MTEQLEGMAVCSCTTCAHSGQPQPLSAFGRNDSVVSGRSYYCKACASAYQLEWKKAHPEAAAKWRKEYVARNKERNKARREAEKGKGAIDGQPAS